MGRRSLPWMLGVAVAVLAAACGGSDRQAANPAGPSLSLPAQAAGPATLAPAGQGGTMVARGVAGELQGRFDFTHLWGEEWWQFYSDSTCSGTITHLGLARLYTRHIPNLQTGALQQGEFRIVAANGDELRGTYEGQATADPEHQELVHGTATFVMTEGTGRFAGATGSFDVTFLEVLDDPSWVSAGVTWTLSGTVMY